MKPSLLPLEAIGVCLGVSWGGAAIGVGWLAIAWGVCFVVVAYTVISEDQHSAE